MKKVLLVVLVVILSVSILASCSSTRNYNAIKKDGEFVMGLDDSFPPMGFVDETGELVGFDVDLAKAVADQMGLSVKLQPIDWSAKEMELESGNIDVIWNGYTITDERKEKVLMSEPYMENTQVIVVVKDSDITTLSDLAGKKVAVQDGSTAQGAIAKNEDLAASIGEQIDFKDNVTALLDVSSGQVDALAVDSVVANYYLSKDPGKYVILDETLAPEQYGIGFRKGDGDFHDTLIAAFQELKDNGTAAEISIKWFGRDVISY